MPCGFNTTETEATSSYLQLIIIVFIMTQFKRKVKNSSLSQQTAFGEVKKL